MRRTASERFLKAGRKNSGLARSGSRFGGLRVVCVETGGWPPRVEPQTGAFQANAVENHLDANASLHHDAMMRTTIDLPPELHGVLASLATSNGKTLSQTAVSLMQRGLEAQVSGTARVRPAKGESAGTGLPVVRFPRAISEHYVRALEDEA
jgi:hypothetical protein